MRHVRQLLMQQCAMRMQTLTASSTPKIQIGSVLKTEADAKTSQAHAWVSRQTGHLMDPAHRVLAVVKVNVSADVAADVSRPNLTPGDDRHRPALFPISGTQYLTRRLGSSLLSTKGSTCHALKSLQELIVAERPSRLRVFANV